VHINHALLRLVREDSKRLLNALVVPVAVEKTRIAAALAEPVRGPGGTGRDR
jgi:hypothetical protein